MAVDQPASPSAVPRLPLPPAQLAVAWITLFVVGTDLFVISPLLPLIAGDFHTSAAHAGLLVTVFALAYVVAAPLFGHVADRHGRRGVLLGCLCAFAVANLLTALATGLPEMLAARLACGLAAAGVTPSLYALVGDAAPANRRSTWIAIAVTGLLSALPLGATAGTWAGAQFGWPSVFMVIGGLAALLLGLNRLAWSRAHPLAGGVHVAAEASWVVPLARALLPTVAWASALYGMYTYLGAGLAGLGYDAQAIAGIVFIYGITAFAGALIGGRVADRIGPRSAVRLSLGGLCLVFAALEVSARSGWLIGLTIGLTSIAAQTFFPAQQALLIETFSRRRATALSWNNSALFLGITLGSLAGGQVIRYAGFAGIPILSVGLSLAGLLACARRAAASDLAETGDAAAQSAPLVRQPHTS